MHAVEHLQLVGREISSGHVPTHGHVPGLKEIPVFVRPISAFCKSFISCTIPLTPSALATAVTIWIDTVS